MQISVDSLNSVFKSKRTDNRNIAFEMHVRESMDSCPIAHASVQGIGY